MSRVGHLRVHLPSREAKQPLRRPTVIVSLTRKVQPTGTTPSRWRQRIPHRSHYPGFYAQPRSNRRSSFLHATELVRPRGQPTSPRPSPDSSLYQLAALIATASPTALPCAGWAFFHALRVREDRAGLPHRIHGAAPPTKGIRNLQLQGATPAIAGAILPPIQVAGGEIPAVPPRPWFGLGPPRYWRIRVSNRLVMT